MLLLGCLAACIEETDPSPPLGEAPLREAGLRIEVDRVADKPGTFGDLFYTVFVEGNDACTDTTDGLAGTWGGVPMTLLSTGFLRPDGRCETARFVIAAADVPNRRTANILVRDDSGMIGMTIPEDAFETGITVPATPVWQLTPGSVAMFQWSRPVDGVSARLCFQTSASPVCVSGRLTNDPSLTKLEFMLPLDLPVVGDVPALLDLGADDVSFPTCRAAHCKAFVPRFEEHPATVTVP